MLSIHDAAPVHAPAVQALYEFCFPAALRAPWATQWDCAGTGQTRLRVAVDSPTGGANGRVLGFSVTGLLDTETAYLAHLAVEPAARAHGIGSLLVADARQHTRAVGANWLLAEVDTPDAPSHDWHGDPARRVEFAHRQGALVASARYGTPVPEGNGLRGAWLLSLPLRRQGALLDGDAAGDWARLLWSTWYGVPAEDPRLGFVLTGQQSTPPPVA